MSEDQQEGEAVEVPDSRKEEIIRALAWRARKGKLEPRPLHIPNYGDLTGTDYYVTLNDPSVEARDAFQNSFEQYKQESAATLDDEGKVVSQAVVVKQNRIWPVMEAIVNYEIISDAVLPKENEDGTMGSWKWRPTSKTANLRNLNQTSLYLCYALAETVYQGVMGKEVEAVVKELGE